jgi:hypothetical protein
MTMIPIIFLEPSFGVLKNRRLRVQLEAYYFHNISFAIPEQPNAFEGGKSAPLPAAGVFGGLIIGSII